MTWLTEFIAYFRYTPKGKKNWGQAGVINILPNTSSWAAAQRGVERPTVGVNIRRFAVRYFVEVNEKLQGNTGEVVARAISDQAAREITVEGETASLTGVMAFTFGVALTANQVGAGGLNNDISTWNSGGTTVLVIMDEVTETQERAGWRSINMRLSSNPQLHP